MSAKPVMNARWPFWLALACALLGFSGHSLAGADSGEEALLSFAGVLLNISWIFAILLVDRFDRGLDEISRAHSDTEGGVR